MIKSLLGKLVYISGPMSGYENYNFQAFFDAERVLTKFGIRSLNPAKTDYNDKRKTWNEYLIYDLLWILKEDIDSLILIDGWYHSVGANVELFIAMKIMNIPIYYLNTKSQKLYQVNPKINWNLLQNI